MPPVSGFESIAEHLVGLIAEVAYLKDEIKVLKTNLKTDNVAASGSAHVKNQSRNIQTKPQGQDSTPGYNVVARGAPHSQSTSDQTQNIVKNKNSRLNPEAKKFAPRKSTSDDTQSESCENFDQDWHIVQHKKQKKAIKGAKQPSGTFK